jgi:hypothetical protein
MEAAKAQNWAVEPQDKKTEHVHPYNWLSSTLCNIFDRLLPKTFLG